jgi:hypothetical protein
MTEQLPCFLVTDDWPASGRPKRRRGIQVAPRDFQSHVTSCLFRNWLFANLTRHLMSSLAATRAPRTDRALI